MLPDWVSNPGPLTYESGALPIALRDPATRQGYFELKSVNHSARSGGKMGISFRPSLTLGYIVCFHYNRLIEAILMSTNNIPFSI